ncbi:MAG TPA: OmpA family protein [Myxococcota bacterium]|jgi:peptidoglycan-associated lipoprotein|nr:OmpA family protein [Myxococcota bacterium]
MRTQSFVRVAVISMAVLSLATACSKKPKEAVEPTSRSSFDEGAASREAIGPQRSPELKTVYFDFDRSEIRRDQVPTLKGNADAINRHSEWKTITIEGHTDERGTEEYNLALGDRRALSAKQYLENLGISGAKLATVSLGESQPAVAGHDEAAWAKNRRDEFLYSK